MQTVEYAPGRLADLFGDPNQPPVLLWHGAQTDARAAVRTLAELVAGHGLSVVAPDWNSHADDRGRSDLLASVRFTRQHVEHPDALVLIGWSLGGVAAAGLTVHAREHGIRVAHTLCLAGAFMVRDPISGDDVAAALREADPSPFTLLHGLADEVVPLAASRDFAGALKQNGWPVELIELPADHGSIAGAAYDPTTDRYSSATDAATVAVATDVAARVAAVSSR